MLGVPEISTGTVVQRIGNPSRCGEVIHTEAQAIVVRWRDGRESAPMHRDLFRRADTAVRRAAVMLAIASGR